MQYIDNEHTPAEINEAKRRKKNAITICFVFLFILISIIAFCAYKLVPYIGEFQYETKVNHLKLPDIEKPSIVHVQISYLGEAPKDIIVYHDDKPLSFQYDFEIHNNETDKVIDITYNTDMQGSYELALIPQDNYELKFETTVEPSPDFLISEIHPYRSENGDLWVMVTAEYDIEDARIRLFIRGDDSHYCPILCDTVFESKETKYFNLSELITALSVNTSEMSGIAITLSETTNTIRQNNTAKIRIKDWCEYDESFKTEYSFNMKDTNQYLLSLPDSAFRYKKPSEEGLESIQPNGENNENTETSDDNIDDETVKPDNEKPENKKPEDSSNEQTNH